ncbi:MAG: hypothetical protein JJU36_00220 [Phycisphaeraceae bacterium]|nr:hypothetical protein [Phycisphaeraceae bacterium]
MREIQRIVLVGHCGADTFALRRALEPLEREGVAIDSASDDADLEPVTDARALWLVNRVLDGDFGAGDGLSLIRRAASMPDPPKLMLVSNFADAQTEAEQLGALPGFGKQRLGDAKLVDDIRHAIGGSG